MNGGRQAAGQPKNRQPWANAAQNRGEMSAKIYKPTNPTVSRLGQQMLQKTMGSDSENRQAKPRSGRLEPTLAETHAKSAYEPAGQAKNE